MSRYNNKHTIEVDDHNQKETIEDLYQIQGNHKKQLPPNKEKEEL
jgi:hypothetical protein